METFILILAVAGIVFAFLQIILFFKLWGMTNDVRALKEINCKPYNFKVDFYKWVAANNVEKAKEVLFNRIGNSPDFKQIIEGGNETYLNQLKEQLNSLYKKELNAIGMESINFSEYILFEKNKN